MGQTNSHWLWQLDELKIPPDYGMPKYDPMLGFPNGRKERVMVATEEEMQSAGLPQNMRDYCAHKWLDFLSCQKDKFPFIYKCADVLHAYHHCEFEDYVLRMKEYEREQRITALKEKRKNSE